MMNPQVIPALIRQESGGNPNAVSPKGAAGIMQIMPDTARNPGFGVAPLQGWDGLDPRTATVDEQKRFGTDYLNAMSQHFGGDTRLALAAYNAGPGAVQQHGGVPPYKETQNYVNSITGATQMTNDWRSRAEPVSGIQLNAAAPAATNDWRSRAEPIVASAGGDWRSRAQTVHAVGAQATQGGNPNDMGAGAAALQGFNSAIPFGERIAAGLGAVGATAFDKIAGIEDPGIAGNYEQIRGMQKTTREASPNAYLGGAVTGIAASLPLASAKVVGGGQAATTGVRGAINEIPAMLASTGNFVRGGKVAAGAGVAAKAANLAGKAVRGAAVAAPAGAAYSYGASEHDLDSGAALQDAGTGALLAGGVGGAAPLVGAVAGSVVPKVSDEISSLAKVAKDRFGINLSLDQISPTRVRSTVQKVSQSIPGSGVDAFQQKQRDQWLKGVAQTIGETSDNVGPATIKKYLKRASDDFDNVLSGKTLTVTQGDLKNIQGVATAATRKVTGDVAKVVKNNVDDFLADLGKFVVGKQRTISGEKLASLRSQIISDLPSIDSQAREHVGDIVDKIDDIIARHTTTQEQQVLTTARRQWRNFRTLEPLLEKSTDGTINPTQLMQRVASSKFIKAARSEVGDDDLIDLARIGKQFMTKKEGSDTAQKLAYGGGLGAVGTAAVTSPASLPVMLLGAGGAVGANRGYQSLVNQSPRVVRSAVDGAKKAGPPIATMLAAPATQHTPRSKRKKQGE